MPMPATACATPAPGTSRTHNTNSRLPTSCRPSKTPSRSWTTCRKRPAKPASRLACVSRKILRLIVNNLYERRTLDRRSTFVRNRLCLPQSLDLPHVVQSVYQMKLSPLRCVQRTKDGMIQQFPPRAPLLFTMRDDLVDLGDLRNYSIAHGFRRCPSRQRVRRSFTPLGQVAEIDRNQNLAALPHCGQSSQRLSCFNHALEAFQRPRIGQVEMFQHFARTPFLGRVPTQFLVGHISKGACQCLLKLLQMGVHQAVLVFRPSSGRMRRAIKALNSLTGRMPGISAAPPEHR